MIQFSLILFFPKIYGQVKYHHDLDRTPFPNLDPCTNYIAGDFEGVPAAAFAGQSYSVEELWIKRQKQGKILKIRWDSEEGQKEKETTKVVAGERTVLHLIIQWGLRWC